MSDSRVADLAESCSRSWSRTSVRLAGGSSSWKPPRRCITNQLVSFTSSMATRSPHPFQTSTPMATAWRSSRSISSFSHGNSRTTCFCSCPTAYDASRDGRTGLTGLTGPPAKEGTSRRRVHTQVTHPSRTIIETDSVDAPDRRSARVRQSGLPFTGSPVTCTQIAKLP